MFVSVWIARKEDEEYVLSQAELFNDVHRRKIEKREKLNYTHATTIIGNLSVNSQALLSQVYQREEGHV